MKQSAKIATLAVALFTGFSGTAMANGTEMPAPPQAPSAAAPAPAPEPYMPPPQTVRAMPSSMTGPYFGLGAGIAIPGNDGVDTGYLINGALGYRFNNARLEAALGYQRHGLQNIDGHLSYLTVMANGYYDFDEMAGVRPYVMGGLGVADEVRSNNDSRFVWQVGAGIGIRMDDRTTIDLGYRYLKPNGDLSFKSHNIMAGIRYQF